MWVPRLRKSTKLVWGITAVGSCAFLADAQSESQLLQRNVRTFYNGIAIAIDYKLNFNPSRESGSALHIEMLHERVANRLFDVLERNGGLYIKIGQVIGTQSAMLPTAYQRRARRLFDSAHALPFQTVERVFMEDFGGKHPSQVFAEFDEIPVASASIAQVHKARLHSGEEVAVKIQRPAVRKQLDSDLFAFRFILRMYEWVFDLPLSWSSGYVETQFRMETDFISESRNAQKSAQHFASEPSLCERIHVPKVYTEFTSPRVLVCEWVDGVQLTDKDRMASMNISYKEAMKTAIDAFSFQIFKTGFVHGDPHPGNVLVRRHPKKGNAQVILLDHGLYIQESEKFRVEYCTLWEALFMLDLDTMTNICKGWGIHDANMFASITLQRPYSGNKALHIPQQQVKIEDVYEFQAQMKERIKHFLKDQSLFPRELIFISRNMNLMRANNAAVGSPVNRINIMARWAVGGLSLTRDPVTHSLTSDKWWRQWFHHIWRTFVFDFTLSLMSLSFWLVRLRQFIQQLIVGRNAKGFEEIMDKTMRDEMQRQFGIKIDESMFSS